MRHLEGCRFAILALRSALVQLVYLSVRLAHGLALAVALGMATVGCGSEPRVDLAADVDRDEIVDFDRDEADEDVWTADRGAIFLNNNDSDEDSGAPDHADAVVNGPGDLADLAVLRLRQISSLPVLQIEMQYWSLFQAILAEIRNGIRNGDPSQEPPGRPRG